MTNGLARWPLLSSDYSQALQLRLGAEQFDPLVYLKNFVSFQTRLRLCKFQTIRKVIRKFDLPVLLNFKLLSRFDRSGSSERFRLAEISFFCLVLLFFVGQDLNFASFTRRTTEIVRNDGSPFDPPKDLQIR